jgi:hypothetical protein
MKIGLRTTKNEKAVDWFSLNGPNATPVLLKRQARLVINF